ncbi:hypothetical protein ACS5PN_17010 [Roseateles sp. NT4]|uniref:hypothetical protein n=1 Tax=Roseateles sp. NT4 TaxID=3453715 RepID=UPI003EECB23B
MKPLLALLLLPVFAHADPLYITVPGEAFSLKLDTPALTRIQGQGQGEGRRFKYMASGGSSGITISLFSETAGSGSNEECRSTYWKKTQDAPIQFSDVKLYGGDAALFVSSVMEATLQGAKQKAADGHAYFARNGLCMDLHVSHYPYQPGSEKRVEAVLQSLALVQ